MSCNRRVVFQMCLGALALSACAPTSRLGMVVDRQTGLQFGSIVEKNLVIDPAQFSDRRVKLTIRNISGDPAYDLGGFRQALEAAYRARGYDIATSDEFGILVDISLRHSAQATQDFRQEFAALGAVAGGLGSYGATRGGLETAAGTVAGASLGYILGTYQQEETFIVVAEMTVALIDKQRGATSSSIVFGKSADSKSERIKEYQGFRDRVATRVAVFAGGANIDQARISGAVRERFFRIMKDMI